MTPLSQRLKEATRPLHVQAERAGLMPALLRGELPRARYVALLWQLEGLYAALEAGLRQPRAPAIDPRLHRRAALQADLLHLASGPPAALLPATQDYQRHLQSLPPPLLAAHAYVRYLGDLAGGQMLRRIVGRTYALVDDGLRFYAFDGDPAALAAGLRRELDALPAELGDAVVAEAQAGFRRHVLLFEALDPAHPAE